MDGQFAAWVYVVLALLGLMVAVLWVLLPFAVFGIKPLMQQVLREQRRTNDLLHEMQQRERKP